MNAKLTHMSHTHTNAHTHTTNYAEHEVLDHLRFIHIMY